ncbi:MAG: hypothetical protein HY079_05850 [Elusimicrobia bacterium]|nr:hypothetical protein [Elusimicrobiota bacterium]
MFTLILTVAMTQTAPAPKPVAQFQPCVWPNKCVSQPVAQFQPCVWPNKCAAPVAQVQTCVWPHKCATPKS